MFYKDVLTVGCQENARAVSVDFHLILDINDIIYNNYDNYIFLRGYVNLNIKLFDIYFIRNFSLSVLVLYCML